MDQFYSDLEDFKKRNGLNYKDLGEVIGKKENAFRMAVKRQSLSELEKQKIAQLFNKDLARDPTVTYESTYRFEDVVAKKVFDLLRDRLDRMEDKVNDSLALLEAISGIIKHSSHKTMEIDRKLKEVHKDTSESKKILEGR